MSSLAIPATPSPAAAANSGDAAVSASADNHFGDTLRKTRSGPETQAHSHVADGDTKPDQTTRRPDAGERKDAHHARHDDKSAKSTHDEQTTDAANSQPPAAPIAQPVPADQRQTLAADGKALPVATQAAAATGSAAAMATAAIVGSVVTNIAGKPAPAAAAKATTPGALADMALPGVHANLADPAVTDAAGAQTGPAITATAANLLQTPTRADASQASTDHGSGAAATHQGPADFTTQLTQLIGAHITHPGQTAPAPAPLQIAMQATPDQPQPFAQETAQHVAWLAGKGIDKAEIQLNPAKLGPISIEISNHHDRVDVSFAVQHPQTVHALQQTLPQLHDMLAQQGLNLGQASVGQQAPGQQHAAFAQHFAGNGDANSADVETPQHWQPLRITAPGRVDDFA